MAFLIGGANSAADDAYEVANSCRFNDGDAPALTRSLGTATSEKIGTWSYWVKRCNLGAVQMIYGNEVADDNNRGYISFHSDDAWRMVDEAGSGTELKTNRVFRDTGSWYHIVVRVDTTQGTAANRVKLYVNGVQETSFATATYPAEDDELKIFEGGQTNKQHIGKQHSETLGPLDAYLAEFVFCDGQSLAATSFGEFDSDSPTIWKPKELSGLTFGNTGFYLDFEDSGDLGDDESGNTNDFSETNLAATDQSADSPTNNWCTLNPLDNNNATNLPTLSEGNLEVLSVSDSTWSITPGTIALPKSGKWYYEVEAVSGRAGDRSAMAGWANPEADNPLSNGSMFSRNSNGNIMQDDSSIATGYTTWHADGDILGCYIDMDNSKLYWAMNGTIQASGTGISFAGGFDDAAFIIPMVQVINLEKLSVNFGNPATNFAIASGNADANGYGNFEFDPSSGTFDGASKDFYAICTKNLAEFG